MSVGLSPDNPNPVQALGIYRNRKFHMPPPHRRNTHQRHTTPTLSSDLLPITITPPNRPTRARRTMPSHARAHLHLLAGQLVRQRRLHGGLYGAQDLLLQLQQLRPLPGQSRGGQAAACTGRAVGGE